MVQYSSSGVIQVSSRSQIDLKRCYIALPRFHLKKGVNNAFFKYVWDPRHSDYF